MISPVTIFLRNQGSSYGRLTKMNKAVEDREESLETDQRGIENLLLSGWRLYKIGKYDEASQTMQKGVILL